MLKLQWPQMIYLSIMAAFLITNLLNNGERKEPAYYDFFEASISAAIILTLLYFGGFFG